MGTGSGSTRFLLSGDSQRLDTFLADETGLSRRRVRKLIGEGIVWRNGSAVRVQSRKLEAGDVIDILLPPEEIPIQPSPIEPVTIIHEDPHLLAVDKPTGLLSQPIRSGDSREPSMDLRLLLFLADREGHRPFLRMVHRLDRPTSGLMLFARTPQSLPRLDRAWRSGKVRRLYLALLSGHPEWQEKTIDEPISRDNSASWRFHCHPEGNPARSRIRILGRGASHSVALVELDSGRTHQVRVHCSHEGFPVLGDLLYNGPSSRGSGVMLHAWGLRLPHPKTRKELSLNTPVPERFLPLLPPDFPESPWDTEREVFNG